MNIDKFNQWLSERGCEILPPSNQYEKLRFKGREIGIIYTTGRTNGDFANKAIYAFNNKKKWEGSPIKTGRYPNYKKEKKALLGRDGTRCFYCGKEMGDDITIEHLIALSAGGKNSLSNMVLAHKECNEKVGNIPISKKVDIAIKNRSL